MSTSNRLPKFEIYFYATSWTLGIFYSVYHVYRTEDKFASQSNFKYDLTSGWPLQVDHGNYDEEWNEWRSFILSKLLIWLILHHLVARILHHFFIRALPLWYFMVTSLFLISHFGTSVFIVFLLQPVLFTLFILATNSRIVIWIFCCITCFMFTYEYSLDRFIGLHENYYLILSTLMWVYLRCISFSMFGVSKELNWTLIFSFFSYVFYLPCFFLGPIILYDEFHLKLTFESNRNNCKTFRWILAQNMRYFGWLIFTEFLLHYVPINTVEGAITKMKDDDVWILYGTGFVLGIFFFLKYTVVFGLAITWTQAEGYKTPNPPKCIACISLYSEMWRNFDQGLYFFIKKYIYVPCMNLTRSRSLIKKIWVSFVCFTFIFLWHGLHDYVFKWAALNYIGIMIETIARSISKTKTYSVFKEFVGYRNERRILALVCAPLTIMSAVSNFYFIGGLDVAETYFEFFFKRGSVLSLLCLWFFVYALCHVAMEQNDVQKQEIEESNKFGLP